MPLLAISDIRICVVGLGYVGLPLSVFLGREFPVIGFDIDRTRVEQLKAGIDRTREVTDEELALAHKLVYSCDQDEIGTANFFIVAVPTPIDRANRPDLTPLEKASEMIGRHMRPSAIVVYESTVYPGATEEVCVPILERVSGLKLNRDFFAGYSPERVNPADPAHRLPNIKKVTSGSTPEAAKLIDDVYARVIKAGTHMASSIRVAEAAKVIENVQRDVNIALFNELALLFKRLGIESREVFEAAGTKWNFHFYRPGLVGGHCIGVDPYYLTHKAQTVGFHPEMILAGRRINDSMPSLIAQDIIKRMLQRGLRVDGARILVMGFAFKQNCPDVRNTKVAELVRELEAFGHKLTICDPLVDAEEVLHEYGVAVHAEAPGEAYDAIVLAVRHDEFVAMGSERLRKLLVRNGLLYDIKEVLAVTESDARI